MTEINAEDVNERAKLLMHRFIACRVRKDPSVIDRARENLHVLGVGRPDRTWWVTEWLAILERSPADVARFLTMRHEYAYQMRNCSPFFGEGVDAVDFTDYNLRIRLWRKAKRGIVLSRSRNKR